jgi:acyl-coenzyme A synthetase/AMP-(fatty) acid ligase
VKYIWFDGSEEYKNVLKSEMVLIDGLIDNVVCKTSSKRSDYLMIKVKGYRVELGEVESAIAKQKSIDQFCVVPLKDSKYGNKLYCFYSTTTNIEITKSSWLNTLRNILPDYMIPYDFIYQKTLPQTSSGKVDRVALAKQINDQDNT